MSDPITIAGVAMALSAFTGLGYQLGTHVERVRRRRLIAACQVQVDRAIAADERARVEHQARLKSEKAQRDAEAQMRLALANETNLARRIIALKQTVEAGAA